MCSAFESTFLALSSCETQLNSKLRGPHTQLAPQIYVATVSLKSPFGSRDSHFIGSILRTSHARSPISDVCKRTQAHNQIEAPSSNRSTDAAAADDDDDSMWSLRLAKRASTAAAASSAAVAQRRLMSRRTTSPETIAALKELLGDRLSTAQAVREVRVLRPLHSYMR